MSVFIVVFFYIVGLILICDVDDDILVFLFDSYRR